MAAHPLQTFAMWAAAMAVVQLGSALGRSRFAATSCGGIDIFQPENVAFPQAPALRADEMSAPHSVKFG
jgi:hypothetical protein